MRDVGQRAICAGPSRPHAAERERGILTSVFKVGGYPRWRWWTRCAASCRILEKLPEDMNNRRLMFDQSLFVRAGHRQRTHDSSSPPR